MKGGFVSEKIPMKILFAAPDIPKKVTYPKAVKRAGTQRGTEESESKNLFPMNCRFAQKKAAAPPMISATSIDPIASATVKSAILRVLEKSRLVFAAAEKTGEQAATAYMALRRSLLPFWSYVNAITEMQRAEKTQKARTATASFGPRVPDMLTARFPLLL